MVSISNGVIAVVVIGMALIDRFLIRRQQLVFESIGEPVLDREHGKFSFPCEFNRKSLNDLRGAVVQYRLFDDKDPTNVLSGKDVNLDFLKLGDNRVNLFFSDKYLLEGNWQFQAVLTHGNCRWNPLYRIFPFRTIMTKHLVIKKD